MFQPENFAQHRYFFGRKVKALKRMRKLTTCACALILHAQAVNFRMRKAVTLRMRCIKLISTIALKYTIPCFSVTISILTIVLEWIAIQKDSFPKEISKFKKNALCYLCNMKRLLCCLLQIIDSKSLFLATLAPKYSLLKATLSTVHN
jgi:hypothetical protein